MMNGVRPLFGYSAPAASWIGTAEAQRAALHARDQTSEILARAMTACHDLRLGRRSTGLNAGGGGPGTE